MTRTMRRAGTKSKVLEPRKEGTLSQVALRPNLEEGGALPAGQPEPAVPGGGPWPMNRIPPTKPPRPVVDRSLNLPLGKAAADRIKSLTRLYPGQQADFLSRLAQRYEQEHLAADLAAVVEEKERERRVALGLEPQPAVLSQLPPAVLEVDEEGGVYELSVQKMEDLMPGSALAR